MERISHLIEKIRTTYYQNREKTLIDLDLLLDYTRVMYADLLEWRADLESRSEAPQSAPGALAATAGPRPAGTPGLSGRPEPESGHRYGPASVPAGSTTGSTERRAPAAGSIPGSAEQEPARPGGGFPGARRYARSKLFSRQAGTETRGQTETATESQTGGETKTLADTEGMSEPETVAKSETAAASATSTRLKTAIETGTESETGGEAKTLADTEGMSEPDTGTESQTGSKTKTLADTEGMSEPDTVAKSETAAASATSIGFKTAIETESTAAAGSGQKDPDPKRVPTDFLEPIQGQTSVEQNHNTENEDEDEPNKTVERMKNDSSAISFQPPPTSRGHEVDNPQPKPEPPLENIPASGGAPYIPENSDETKEKHDSITAGAALTDPATRRTEGIPASGPQIPGGPTQDSFPDFKKIFEKANTSKAEGRSDIRKLIGINDKYLFLNELFNNHKTEYEETLDHLNGMDSAVDARQFLEKEIAPKYKWRVEDATVESFYWLVERHLKR